MKCKYTITGLDCPNCAAKLEGMIAKLEGIESVKINFLTERVTMESDLDADAALALAQSYAKKFSPSVQIQK